MIPITITEKNNIDSYKKKNGSLDIAYLCNVIQKATNLHYELFNPWIWLKRGTLDDDGTVKNSNTKK